MAQGNDITIVVVISPYAGITKYHQQKYNTACDIAVEYGVLFINCNLLTEQIGLNYAIDAADPEHLNYKGSQKYSSYIGKYLKENFEISDRRSDSGYNSWLRNADYIERESGYSRRGRKWHMV